MVTSGKWLRKVFAYIAYPEWSLWILSLLIALLIGKVVVSPRLSFSVLALIAGIAVLLLRLLQYAYIPVSRIEKIFCYLVFITGFFGVVLFPINLGPFTLFPYRIFLVLLWGLFLARMLIHGKVVLPLYRIKPYMAFFGIWTVYAVFSLGWAAAKGDAICHVLFLFMGVSLLFFAVIYFSNYRDLRRLYMIWFSIFCLLILIGFWEHRTGQHLPVSGYYETKLLSLEPYVIPLVKYRPTGVFNNPNDYATFLALSIPFGLSLARYYRKLWLRAFGMATVLLGGYLILATGSRGNLLALLLELGFLWFFLVRGFRRLKLAVALTAAVGVALVIAPALARAILQNATEQLASILYEIPLESGSIYVRRNLIKNGLLFVYQTAGFGVGAGNAEYWIENFARYNTFGILNLHNWWLEVLVDYGIFIFAGYLIFYLSIVRRLWRMYKHTTGTQRMICEALLLSLVGFSIASVSSSSIMAFAPQWILFGFSLAFLNAGRRQGVV